MKKDEALVHISRLALSGRHQDIERYIRRMTRSKDLASVKPQLDQLLVEAPTVTSPARSASFEAVPVDLDSRMQLLRFEPQPFTDHEPVWTADIRNTFSQIINERRHAENLVKAGLSPTKSILFVGPPGVGKSLGAHWLAAQLNLPLLILDLSAVMSSFLGRTGSNLKMVLDYAKSMQCVLLLDEIDAIAKRRDDSGDIGELKRLVNVLLQEIDDWPTTSVMVAATNHPDLLDPAVWRRFDSIIEFPLPVEQDVRKSVKLFLREDLLEISPAMIDLFTLVLSGKSYSDIEKVCLKLRKESLLKEVELLTLLKQYVSEHMSKLDKSKRYAAVDNLLAVGFSQRKISELMGISRDTLRKHINDEGA